MRATDPRVKRTRQRLRQALVELVLTHGYDAISVGQIAAHAHLARATFYLHYADKHALLLDALQGLVDDLVAQIDLEDDALLQPGPHSVIATIFRHAEQHATLYRLILHGSGAADVQRRLREIATVQLEAYLRRRVDPARSPIPLDVAGSFLARSVLAMVDWWLGQPAAYSADQMVALCHRLCADHLPEVLGGFAAQ